MKCPQCKATVPDGTEICGKCDYILDASFLGDVTSGETGEDEPPAEMPTAAKARAPRAAPAAKPSSRAPPSRAPAARARARAPEPEPEEEEEAPPPPRPKSSRPSYYDDEPPEEPRPKPVAAAPTKPKVKYSLEVGESKFTRDTEALAENSVASFSALPLGEKISVFALGTMAFLLLMPWRETADEGAEVGLFAGAWPMVLPIALGAVAVWGRVSRQIPLGLGRLHTVLVQLGAGLVGSGFALVRMFLDTNLSRVKSPFGSELLISSHPHVGAAMTVLAGLVLAVSAFLVFNEPES